MEEPPCETAATVEALQQEVAALRAQNAELRQVRASYGRNAATSSRH